MPRSSWQFITHGPEWNSFLTEIVSWSSLRRCSVQLKQLHGCGSHSRLDQVQPENGRVSVPKVWCAKESANNSFGIIRTWERGSFSEKCREVQFCTKRAWWLCHSCNDHCSGKWLGYELLSLVQLRYLPGGCSLQNSFVVNHNSLSEDYSHPEDITTTNYKPIIARKGNRWLIKPAARTAVKHCYCSFPGNLESPSASRLKIHLKA